MGRKPVPSESIICVERILVDQTDADQGIYLTISQIRKLVLDHYGVSISKETVTGYMDTLCGEVLANPKGVKDREGSALLPPYEFICVRGPKYNSPMRCAVRFRNRS